MMAQDRVEGFVDQGGFTAARKAGDADQASKRQLQVDIFKVIAACTRQGTGIFRSLACVCQEF